MSPKSVTDLISANIRGESISPLPLYLSQFQIAHQFHGLMDDASDVRLSRSTEVARNLRGPKFICHSVRGGTSLCVCVEKFPFADLALLLR